MSNKKTPESDVSSQEAVVETPVWTVFKYMNKIHVIYMSLGILGAAISGLGIPLFIVIFGFLVDLFIDYETTKDNLLKGNITTLLPTTISSSRNDSNSTYLYANDNYLIFNSKNASVEDQLEELDRKLMNHVYLYTGILGLSWFFYGFGRFMALYFMQHFSLSYCSKLKQKFFASILSQKISWHDKQKPGEFASRISNDFKKFESGINENLAMIFALICSGIFNTACGIYFGWQLALIILICVPVISFGLSITNKYINVYSKEETEIYAQASSIAEESISAVRTVKAFSANDKEKERYNERLKKGFRNAFLRNMFNGLNTAFNWGCLYGFLGIGTFFGVRFIVDGLPGYTLGTFTMVFWSAVSVGYNFGEIAPYLEALSVCRSVATNLFGIIDNTEPEIDPKNSSFGKRIEGDYKAEIEFRNVSFHYPARPDIQILKNLNLKIKAGETVALVGSSGCGKSTIVQLLQKFYEPNSGEVIVNNHRLNDLDIHWWRAQVGVVGQEPVLFDDTIEQNILLGIKDQNGKNHSVVEVSKQANAHAFIDTLAEKYQTYVGDSGTQLSGGQKQRIAIARALISSPSVLLLDEATSALDVRSEKIVQEALDKASKNRTTIVVAHRLSTIKNADRIVVIQNGEIAEQGNHEKLMEQKGVYHKMVEAQQVLVPELPDDRQDLDGSNDRNLRTESVAESKKSFKMELKSSDSDWDSESKDIDEKDMVSYSRLWTLVKSEKWLMLVGVFCSFAFGAGTPIYALLYGALLQEFSENGGNDDGTLVQRCNKYAYGFMGLGIGKFVICFLQILIFGYVGEKLTYKLRRLVFESVLDQEVEWFDRKENSAGAVCARISDDAANIQSASGLRISTLLQAISTMCITVPLGFFYNWQLALFSLVLMPLIFGAYMISQAVSSSQAEKESDVAKKASKVVVQVMNSVRTVISLDKQTFFYSRFENSVLEHEKSMRSEIFKKSALYGISMGTPFGAYCFAFLFGGYLLKSSILSTANMFRIIESMVYGAVAVGQTSVLSGDFAKARRAIASMLSIIDLKSEELEEVTSSESNHKSAGNVEFHDVVFNYPSRPLQTVLDGLSFSANPGETVALVGASGCGKSTTIQLLEQFYKPNKGKILIDGRPITGREWARRQMALVSQEPILFNCSIRENIAYGDTSRTVSDAEILQAAEATNVTDFLSKFPLGLDTPVGQRGTQLSGGQKQRIAIARALIRNPPILLLDEATSALDTQSEKLVQSALDKASQGRTCIVIAHRLKTIVNSSKIIVIHKGKAVEEGTHEELLEKRSYYWKLFNLYKL